jgi:hypothetical protein
VKTPPRWLSMTGLLAAGMLCRAGPAGWAAAAPGDPISSQWEGLLALDQGAWDAGKQAAGKTLWLRVEKADGQWRPEVWGYCRDLNAGDYLGTIAGSSQAGGETELAVRLVVDVHIEKKGQGRSGLGEYKIRFKSNGSKIEGAWQGTFCGEPGQGKVAGTVEPVRPRAAGFAPPSAGEHPVLLLRKADLPALRKKLQSPWGQRLAQKLTAKDDKSMTRMAVGHGLMYALTGDTKYAETAQQLIEADIHAGKWIRTEVHYPYVKVHDAGIVAGEAAIAFDLIHDACTPEFRKNLVDLFARRAFYLWGCPANWSDTSNWSAMYRSGTGMCGLALLGETKDFWPKPPEPRIVRVEPDAALASAPPSGAPIAVLQSGQPVAEWLQTGPLPLGLASDPADALGGLNARIGAGMKVTANAIVKDKTGVLKAETVTKTFDLSKSGRTDRPGVFKLGGGRLGATVFFFTILENPQPGCYMLDQLSGKRQHQWFLYPYVFINGQRFRDGDHVYLPQGRFAVLAPVQTGHCRSNEQILWALTFTAVTEQGAQAWLAQQKADHALEMARWQIMQDVARARGGCNPWGLYWAGVGRQWIENWATWAVGSFGWAMAGEAYTQHAYRAVLPFAHCYRNALGTDLVGRPNLRMTLPRYAGQTMFRADGAFLQGYGPGGSPLGVDNYARGFGLVPDALKPAVLWAWNRTQKLADDGKLKGAYLTEDFLDPMSAAFMFVNYPDPSGGIAEENPAKALPKVLLDDWKGGFAFRNRWQDGDDVVATIYLNWNFAGGEWFSEETGDFRISGLGVDWAVRGVGWGCTGEKTPVPKQPNQNVLELSEPVERGAPAFSRFFKASKDGSAILALDLDYVYANVKKKGDGKTLPPLPAHPRTGMADVYFDRGIKGLRGFAADYSGAAGVPALFAVVDKVTGSAGSNGWHLVTDKSLPVEIAGNVFVIRGANGATLKGTVLAPASPAITTRAQTFGHEATYNGDHQTRTYDRTIIDVPAKDFVFVVMTLQQGNGPAVTAQGTGVATRAALGKQTVGFDGEKIVLGQFAGDLQVVGPLAASLAKKETADGRR